MVLPTEPVGSVPRPPSLMRATAEYKAGRMSEPDYRRICDEALKLTIAEFEATGSPIITDGEITKPSFVSYPLDGLSNLAPDGVAIPFADGHHRQLPRLTDGPFRYARHCGAYVEAAKRFTTRPLKQAVIAPSALSLIYPQEGLVGYSRAAFLADLLDEAEKDVRSCFDAGAVSVQLDFTEGRLAVKLDPSKALLKQFVDLNNALLGRFDEAERSRISVHTCPGGDHDSTHSADVNYAELLPLLFQMRAGAFLCELAAEKDRPAALSVMARYLQPDQKLFVGVIDPIDPRIETANEVADRIEEAARFIPLDRLGITDDCGFSPFGDDLSTARETAFAKIKARIDGIKLAEQRLGVV